MTRMIEVIYEDEVLKPLTPIEGLKKSERTWVILCPRSDRAALHELAGTLTHKEAEEMQKLISEEFEKTDGIEIEIRGIEALNKALGPVDALRFLHLLHREPTDYVEISRRLYNGQTIEEIFERARKRSSK